MLEDQKKVFILGVIIVLIILSIGGMVYFIVQNKEEYMDFEQLEVVEQNSVENNVGNVMESNVKEQEENLIIVHISGQVINPGVISLKEGARIIDAIQEAGGLTKEADLSKINLAYVLADAQKIYIPSVKEKEEVTSVSEENGDSKIVTSGNGEKEKQEEILMININTASETELQKLPGIGSSIATRIVNYRKENGKFNTIEEIQNVSGIGTNKFNKIKNNICVK